jgi:2-polyprenyl-6-hydroxyphenyl methylase/3-demethylubiquinone-9 3-methyltransferase
MDMQIDYGKIRLDAFSRREMDRLMSLPQDNRSDLEQMWFLMDRVWDEYGCDNRKPDGDSLGRFYSHPVWLLNGLFLEQHELSMRHREAISDWIAEAGIESVVDYGGGFGTLAKLIVKKNPRCRVDLYEPYPADSVQRELKDQERVNIVKSPGEYDCLVSTDVLEHVVDPLSCLWDMMNAVKDSGFLIIANNFNPIVKCHLPQTFHLQYSFHYIAKRMGLRKVGHLAGSHATIYQKVKSAGQDLQAVRKYERFSKVSFPFFEGVRFVVRFIRRIVRMNGERKNLRPLGKQI